MGYSAARMPVWLALGLVPVRQQQFYRAPVLVCRRFVMQFAAHLRVCACISGLLVSLSAAPGFAQVLTNGDFSANAAAYTTFPGYSGGSNPAAPTGWTIAGTNIGVNSFVTPGL